MTSIASRAVPWLPELAPTEPNRHLIPASSGAQLASTTAIVGASAVEWAVEVGYDVAARVAVEIPGHIGEGGLDVLRMGTESTVLQLLKSLAGRGGSLAATSESLGGIPDFIRRRVSLESMLRGISLGHAAITTAFLTECGRRGLPEARHEQMRVCSERAFEFFDRFSTQMSTAYREEEARWVNSETATKLAVIEDLLRDQDQDTRAASRRLHYDLTREHVALILWSTARAFESEERTITDAARELLRELGSEQALVVPANIGVVWVWMTPESRPAGGPGNGSGHFVDRLSGATLPRDIHAVAGSSGHGLAGFHASHDDALAAFAIRAASPHSGGVTPYEELDLLSLLLADRPRARRFAQRELGALAEASPTILDLRNTVAAYIDAGGSTNLAAQELHVSRNTVTYRIRRAEETLGRPLTERPQQLRAALTIMEECSGSAALNARSAR